MGQEWELKYRFDESRRENLLGDATVCRLVKKTETIRMESQYFDTPEGGLSAKKQTLRLRKENQRSVVTFKTAGDGPLRGEWEYEAEELTEAASRLAALGAPVEDIGEVVPVCGARFVRTAQRLVFGDATEAELALDEGELFAGKCRAPLCELELELKRGSADTVLAFASFLENKYRLVTEPESKFVRARRLIRK